MALRKHNGTKSPIYRAYEAPWHSSLAGRRSRAVQSSPSHLCL